MNRALDRRIFGLIYPTRIIRYRDAKHLIINVVKLVKTGKTREAIKLLNTRIEAFNKLAKLYQSLTEDKQHIYETVFPWERKNEIILENYASLLRALQGKKVASQCKRCGRVFLYKKGKKYCGKNEGKHCGKKAADLRFYKHHPERKTAALKWMQETRTEFKLRGESYDRAIRKRKK